MWQFYFFSLRKGEKRLTSVFFLKKKKANKILRQSASNKRRQCKQF